MADLFWYQYLYIGVIFAWSGFVRTSLGFGGAVLALPFLLLVLNKPLVFLPIIAIHLLIFSSWIAWRGHQSNLVSNGSDHRPKSHIDWGYLIKSMKVLIIPKLIGVVGLLTLPSQIMTNIIFVIVIVYAIGYVLNKPIKSNNKYLDYVLLAVGGYVSGTSLVGAPLIVAVFASHVPKNQLRDTLFVLWFILVLIKLISFVIAGVDLQLIHHLWLLPCALVGHLLGERVHRYMLTVETHTFFRFLGLVLLIVSVVGLLRPPG